MMWVFIFLTVKFNQAKQKDNKKATTERPASVSGGMGNSIFCAVLSIVAQGIAQIKKGEAG